MTSDSLGVAAAIETQADTFQAHARPPCNSAFPVSDQLSRDKPATPKTDVLYKELIAASTLLREDAALLV